MNAAGLRSLDELLDAELTEPQLMHMGFSQMKKRKDALHSIAMMAQQRNAQLRDDHAREQAPQGDRRSARPSPPATRNSSTARSAPVRSRRTVAHGWTSRCHSGSNKPLQRHGTPQAARDGRRSRCGAGSRTPVQLELQVDMPSTPAEEKALQMQLRTEMATALGVDVSQIGEVELSPSE